MGSSCLDWENRFKLISNFEHGSLCETFKYIDTLYQGPLCFTKYNKYENIKNYYEEKQILETLN